MDEGIGRGEGHRSLSWIWKVHGAGDGVDEGTQDG